MLIERVLKNKLALLGLLVVVFVILAYRFIHYLMRFKLVNKIITYTSLSKYKFWRRYKSPIIRAK